MTITTIKKNISVIDYEKYCKKINGIYFYLSIYPGVYPGVLNNGWSVERRASRDWSDSYYVVNPPFGFGIFTKDKIDNLNSENICIVFDGKSEKWMYEKDIEFREYNLSSKYNIPEWLKWTYIRFHKEINFIDIVKLYFYASDFIEENLIEAIEEGLTIPGSTIKKLSKDPNFDLNDYLDKNLIQPTRKYFESILDIFFNKGALEEMVDLIKYEDTILENKEVLEEATKNQFDEFKNKLVDVYDIAGLINKLTKGQYQSFIWREMALIQSESGRGVILDPEAIGLNFDSPDEKLSFDVSEPDEEEEQEDGSKIIHTAFRPYGKIKLSINDIRKHGESHQEEAGDFFSKCYGSNWRCSDNLSYALDELKDFGYFDKDSYVEEYKYTEDDKNDIIRKIAEVLAKVDPDPSVTVDDYFKDITASVNAGDGVDWIDALEGTVRWKLENDFLKLIGRYGEIAGHLIIDPEEYIDRKDVDRLNALIGRTVFKGEPVVQDLLEKELEKIASKKLTTYLSVEDYTEAMLNAINIAESLANVVEKETFVENTNEEYKCKTDRIAELVAKEYKGKCGAFGGENPLVRANRMCLFDQSGRCWFRFNDDGSIDFENIDDVIRQQPENWGIRSSEGTDDFEEEVADVKSEFSHFNSLKDICNSGLSWFEYEIDEPKVSAKIKDILDPDTVLEALSKDKAQIKIVDNDKNTVLYSHDFDRMEDEAKVCSDTFNKFSELDPEHKNMTVLVSYFDNMFDKWEVINIGSNDEMYRWKYDDFLTVVNDKITDFYNWFEDIHNVKDFEPIIAKMVEGKDPYDIDAEETDVDTAATILTAAIYLKKPVSSMDKIGYNDDADYIRITFKDGTSEYIYNQGIFAWGVKFLGDTYDWTNQSEFIMYEDIFDKDEAKKYFNVQDVFIESNNDKEKIREDLTDENKESDTEVQSFDILESVIDDLDKENIDYILSYIGGEQVIEVHEPEKKAVDNIVSNYIDAENYNWEPESLDWWACTIKHPSKTLIDKETVLEEKELKPLAGDESDIGRKVKVNDRSQHFSGLTGIIISYNKNMNILHLKLDKTFKDEDGSIYTHIALRKEKVEPFNDKDYFIESLIEEYDRISKEAEAWLDKQIEDHNFKVVSKRDYPDFHTYGTKDEKNVNVHYQILSNEGNKNKDDLEKEVDWLDRLLEILEGRTGSPCTYNMGLQDDGYISAGFDCRATSSKFLDSFLESKKEERYIADKYGKYLWGVLDTKTSLYWKENDKPKFFRDEDKAIDYCGKLNKDTYIEGYKVVYKPEVGDRLKFVRPFYIPEPEKYDEILKKEYELKQKLNSEYLNKICEIDHISSWYDHFSVSFADGQEIDRVTMHNFEPVEKEPELYTILESYINKDNNKTCDILKDFNNGYVLVQYENGTKDVISKDNLEEKEIRDDTKLNVLDVETTESFDNDYNNLSNPKEAEWFLEENGSNSLLVLQRLGLQNAIRSGKCKQESIANNSIVDNGVTVYSLYKGAGSSNQFRAYFYRKGNKCIFVRCLLKKRTQNGPEEYKAIKDTADYAKSH